MPSSTSTVESGLYQYDASVISCQVCNNGIGDEITFYVNTCAPLNDVRLSLYELVSDICTQDGINFYALTPKHKTLAIIQHCANRPGSGKPVCTMFLHRKYLVS